MSLPAVSSCDGCCACCRHMGFPAFVHDVPGQMDERFWTDLPGELKRPLLEYIESYRSPPDGELDGPCWWLDLDTQRCKHHEFRPQVCREFQVGSRACLDWRHADLLLCRG